jgi:hypothetical protein
MLILFFHPHWWWLSKLFQYIYCTLILYFYCMYSDISILKPVGRFSCVLFYLSNLSYLSFYPLSLIFFLARFKNVSTFHFISPSQFIINSRSDLFTDYNNIHKSISSWYWPSNGFNCNIHYKINCYNQNLNKLITVKNM